LARCDAMIVVPNWEHSKGTQGEIYEAERLEIPIFYNLASLIAWHNVNA
jgi:hypothetical protein